MSSVTRPRAGIDRWLLGLVTLACLFLAFRFFNDYRNDGSRRDLLILILVLATAAWLLYLQFRPSDTRRNVLLLIGSLLISLWILDWAAGRLFEDPRVAAARAAGVPFDTRNRLEVVRDLREQGEYWAPAVPPNFFLGHYLKLGEREVLPLSGVASANIVACNEGGYFSRYRSDEYGFRNPLGLWASDQPLELAFVGDSYTAANCVNEGEHFTDILRHQHPRLLNLGAGGNGPLLELAGMREYLSDKPVDTVFWVYFERNDLSDLRRDAKDPILMRYLEQSGFRQHLQRDIDPVDKALRGRIEQNLKEHLEGQPWLFANLRKLLWKYTHGGLPQIQPAAPSTKEEFEPGMALFRQALKVAQAIATQGGGRLVFVYLPEYERFDEQAPSPPWSGARWKGQVLEMVRTLPLDIVDLEPVFSSQPDPVGLFPLRMSGHYNEKGYALVAKALEDYLKAHPHAAAH